jgi:hypothetical protein
VTLDVTAGKGTAAMVHVADIKDDLGSRLPGGRISGIGIGYDEIDALGLAETDLVGLDHELGIFAAVIDGAQHDHAAAVGHLGVCDGVIRPHVNGVLLKAKGAGQPVDCGKCVAVAEAGDESGLR